MTAKELEQFVAEWAPQSLAESYDNVGWMIRTRSQFQKALVCLDFTPDILEEAVEKSCDLVICHHPLLFKPLKSIAPDNPISSLVINTIRSEVSVLAMHTNLDNVIRQGVNYKLAEKLGMDTRRLQVLAPKTGNLCKLIVYVPESHLDVLMDTLFAAGAGHIGNYSECSFSVKGKGSFKPEEGANPYSGNVGRRSMDEEIRLELLVPTWKISTVLEAMRSVHPYETIAYDIIPLENRNLDTGSGAVGPLLKPMPFRELLEEVKKVLNVSCLKWAGDGNQTVETLAICGGSGAFLISQARRSGAQVYLTADLKYHDFFEAGPGFALIDTGHFENEQYTSELICEEIQKKFPTFAVLNAETCTNPVKYF